MRKRMWMAAMCALAALPLWGQQKQESMSASGRERETANTESLLLPMRASGTRAMANLGWAIAGPRRATPFALSAGGNGDEAPSLIVPRAEVFVGYAYTNVRPGGSFAAFNSHGGIGSFEYNVHKYMGLVAELSSGRGHRIVGTTRLGTNMTTYLFGPQLNIRRWNFAVPFGHFLIGGANTDQALTGTASGNNSLALAFGGGLDLVPVKPVAIRLFQADYLMTNFGGPNVGGNSRQDNFRISTGIVFRIGEK